MSLAKTASLDGMKYEETGKKTASNANTVERKLYAKAVTKHNTAYTLWVLACKHKVALLALGNIILVLNWILPEWPTMVLSLFN